MTRKPGLALNEHISLGLELAQMRDRLTVLTATIGNSYPKTVKAAHHARRAAQQLDLLRSQLEDRCAVEHPDNFETYIYYPTTEQRNERHTQ